MAEESQEILLKSLVNAGVSIPHDVSSVQDLTPATFVSISAQCLNLIDETTSFSTSLPDSTVDKFKICTDLALAVKRLGYLGDLSYYKFLYPSEEDLYKVLRFLVERISEISDGIKVAGLENANARRKGKEDDSVNNVVDWTANTDNQASGLNYLKEKLEDLSLQTVVPELPHTEVEDFSADQLTSTESGNLLTKKDTGRVEGTVAEKDYKNMQEDSSFRDQLTKRRYETEVLQNQEKLLMEEVTAKNLEMQHLEEEFELLKAAAEMAFDDQHPVDFYLNQLNVQVDAKKHNIVELESQCDSSKKPLEEKKRSLEESIYGNMTEAQEKLQKLRGVDLEKQSILSEIERREKEHSKLSADLKKQPKLPLRKSYIERIKEITKNSRKQDADIERILKETRELQLESNSIQERLHRTYAVLDEIVFREAKKDPVGRNAYRLLTSIHESFEQISEKILATDRICREVAEHEKKLSAMASPSLNEEKLQTDLDAIVKENEYLKQHLQDSDN